MESTKPKQSHKFLKVVVVGLFLFAGLFHGGQAYAAGGELWATGYNEYGNLGLGYYGPACSPSCNPNSLQQVVDTNWASVSEGFFSTVAIKTDGTLWAWGMNGYGELGLGYVSAWPSMGPSSPTQVLPGTTWISVAQNSGPPTYTYAVRSDGTLWSWGYNGSGQLGLGYSTPWPGYVSSPQQVGSASNWAKLAGGYYQMMAIKTNGTLWTLVDNNFGPTQVQVGSNSDWADVQAGDGGTIALKTNGTLWAWGNTNFGQLCLGHNDNNPPINFAVPTQIGSDSNWASVSMRGNQSVMAIKTNGTLWACGMNVYGNLGIPPAGTYYGPSSPAQVGTDSNWAKVSVGNFPYEYTMAIKTDGTLWAWGDNSSGQLGLGDYTGRHSPTQVGTRTDWGSVSAGSYATMAITAAPTVCTTTTLGNCSLPGPTTSGTSVNGTCGSGYSGACNYLCTNSVWSLNSNSCTLSPTATLSAAPSTIDNGQSSTLTWSSSSATSCGAAGGASWLPAGSPASGNVSVSPSVTSNYQITCTGPGGSANSNNAPVTVLQPTASISANPTRVKTGTNSQISWSASQVKSCVVSGPGLSSTNLSGSPFVTVNAQSTYTITCQTNGTPITKSVTVNVLAGFQEF